MTDTIWMTDDGEMILPPSDLEVCRRLLDDAIESRRPIDADELIECQRVARRLRARGLGEGARSIDDRIREHAGTLCPHGVRLDRFCHDCGL